MTSSTENRNSAIISESIFGMFDGLVSVLGVIIGLAATSGTSNGKIINAAFGLAIASALSMGFGEYQSCESHLRAWAMGISTLVGTLIPIVPFFILSRSYSFVCVGVATFATGLLIGKLRNEGKHGYIQTFILLIIAIGATIIASLLLGGSG